jgi:hypothetical protein
LRCGAVTLRVRFATCRHVDSACDGDALRLRASRSLLLLRTQSAWSLPSQWIETCRVARTRCGLFGGRTPLGPTRDRECAQIYLRSLGSLLGSSLSLRSLLASSLSLPFLHRPERQSARPRS